MLKPPGPGPEEERPIGELVRQLVDEGKAYAEAEVELVKTIAASKAKGLVVPAILFFIAFFAALAGITALAVGIVIALAKFIGPLLAGIAGLLIFAGVAGGLGWYGAERMRRIW